MSFSNESSFLLYRARDANEGALLEAMLEENGIEVRVVGGQGALGFGDLPADVLLVDLHVRPEDAAKGRSLIEAFWRDREIVDSDPWWCAGCGEENGSGFEVCWSCGTVRVSEPAGSAKTEEEPAAVEPARARSPLLWDARMLRVFLACTLLIWLTWPASHLSRFLAEQLATVLARQASGEGSLQSNLAIGIFLVIWFSAAVLIARWGFAKRPPTPNTPKAD